MNVVFSCTDLKSCPSRVGGRRVRVSTTPWWEFAACQDLAPGRRGALLISPVRPVLSQGIAQLGKYEKYREIFLLLPIPKGVWPQGGTLAWREMGALRARGINWICPSCTKWLREAGSGGGGLVPTPSITARPFSSLF